MNRRGVLIVGSLAIAAGYFLFQKTARATTYTPVPGPQQVPGTLILEPIPETPTQPAPLIDLSWLTDFFKTEPTQTLPAQVGPTQELPAYYSDWQTFSDLDQPLSAPEAPADLIAAPDPWADYDASLSEDFALDFEQVYPDSSYNVEDYAMDEDQNLSAFLALIRQFETSTTGPQSYQTLIGGGLFYDFSEHPFILNPEMPSIKSGSLPASKAAGAYQFLPQTWIEARDALQLPDFSPASQDAAAVFLINRRGALGNVKRGEFPQAILKLGKEWASLPGSPYGQTHRTLAEAEQVYQANGGTIA